MASHEMVKQYVISTEAQRRGEICGFSKATGYPEHI